MQISNAPVQIQLPFGNGDGTKTNPVPVPSQTGITPGAVSFTDGFPPVCALPITSGGIPPRKADMNGILFMMSDVDLWMSAGGSFKWNSGFSTAIGGYPIGARVLNTAGTGFWLSIVDNNVTNPDTGGAGWIPEPSGNARVSSVYASAQQTLGVGNVKVIWDTIEFDSFFMWNVVNHRFQAIWAGKYRFSGTTFLTAPAGQELATYIYKNGALAKQCTQFPQTTAEDLTYSFDAIIQCAIGDYLEVFMGVTQSSVLAGTTSGSNQPYVYGQIEFLGA